MASKRERDTDYGIPESVPDELFVRGIVRGVGGDPEHSHSPDCAQVARECNTREQMVDRIRDHYRNAAGGR